MTDRMATLTNRLGMTLLMLFAFTACGGGGGGGGGGFLGEGGETPDTYVITLNLVDANGNPTTTVNTTFPATLQVQVDNGAAGGPPIANQVVDITTDIGVTNPPSGSVLTDANGFGTIQIESDGTLGAGTITATTTAPAGIVSTLLAFEVVAPGLQLGFIDNGNFQAGQIGVEPDSALVFRGSAQLTVGIVDENNERETSAQSVAFSSECLISGESTLDPATPEETTNGQVVVTYTAVTCEGNDLVTATLVDGQSQATATLEIGSVQANRIAFTSAQPETIVLRNTGGTPERNESSVVTFQVLDSQNEPAENVTVNFSLTTDVGGLSLTPASAATDSSGNVQTTVLAGDISTTVRVIASIETETTTLSTVSNVLTVTTGLPDQNSISLSVEGNFVVENGLTTDGLTRNINVRMADRFNNPVIDGTSAVFTTEFGSIEPSCNTVDGACTVTWTSSEPRLPTLDSTTEVLQTILDDGYSCPDHNGSSGPCPSDLGFGRVGASTILVTAIGEESFIDRNGNGIIDQAEEDLFDNVPEAFLDNNEDGVYTPAIAACANGSSSDQCRSGQEEIFVDFNTNGQYDFNNNPAVYNGLLCPLEGVGVWCSRELVNVRDSAIVVMSGSGIAEGWYFVLVRGTQVASETTPGNTHFVYISDLYNNPPPGGSTISITTADGCELLSDSPVTTPNSASNGAVGAQIITGGTGTTPGSITITLTPSGSNPVTRSMTYPCRLNAPEDPNDPNGLVVGAS